jgi:hypothetical protein
MHMLLYFVFVHVTLLVPGYVIISKSNIAAKKPALVLCMGYMTSAALFALFSLASYIFNIPHIWLQVICWLLMAGALYFFIKDKLYLEVWKLRFPVAALVAMSMFALLFIQMPLSGSHKFVPDPKPVAGSNYDTLSVKVLNVAQTNANDNYIPYRQAQFITNRSDPAKDSFIDEWGVHFFQRTPLMGAVTAQYFILLGDKTPIGYTWGGDSLDPGHTYMKFQIIAQTLNCLFVIPAFFLLARFFSRRVAQVTLLFIVPSHFFLYNAFFTWPKSLVIFFVLTSWLLILEKRLRFTLAAGVASGLAYLTHDLGVLYIGTTCTLLLLHKRWRDTAIIAAWSAVFALPWLLTAAVKYKKPSTFIYYPFSTEGIPQIAQKKQIMQQFHQTSPFRLLEIRLQTLFYQLSPYQLMFSEGGQVVGRRLWAFSIFSVPGSVGVGLVVPAVVGLYKKIREKDLLILIFMPLILCCIIIGWPKGLGALHFAEASVVLLMGLGCWWLLRLKNKIWVELCFGFNVIQAILFMTYSYNFAISSWFTQPKALMGTLGMAAIIGGCYVVLRRVVQSPDSATKRVA